MKPNRFVPRKFCCVWPLDIGCIIAANCIFIAAVIQFILTIIAALGLQDMKKHSSFQWREAYAYLIMAVVYSLIMMAASVWFMWAVIHRKSSVVLCWIVVASLWTAQNIVITIILLAIYYDDANLTVWIICFCGGVFAWSIFIYAILVAFGFYKQLKEEHRNPPVAT